MALNFDTISIAGIETEVLTLAGTGNTREFILKSVLTPRELAVFEDIVEDGVGATLKLKMQAWVLSNGRTAFDTYKLTVRTFGSYDAGLRKLLAGRATSTQVAEAFVKLEEVATILAGQESDEDKLTAIAGVL
jgi:hypothetical protein